MSKKFISVYKSKGLKYAAICSPSWENGKKVNNPHYLGRVLDLAENGKEGRFRSRARGEFFYSLENGFSYPVADPAARVEAAIAKGSLNFGHVYCVHKLMERTGLLNLFRDTEVNSPDTLMALITSRLLDNYPDSYASAFFEQTYASILYPKADLSPQAISRYLPQLGCDGLRRDFHRRYIDMVYPETNSIGVLIDSDGLLNDINLYITTQGNHENEYVSQIRLIYVVDRKTFNPIYYRAIPGNVVDTITLKETINELKALNVNIGYSALDYGYNSESNLEELFSLGIDFITRLTPNICLYNELIEKNCDNISHASNRLVYNNKLIFMVMNKVKLSYGRDAYAYIGVDTMKQNDEIRTFSLNEDPNNPMSNDEYEIKRKTAGMFVLVSSLKIDKKDVIKYYFSRQTIEQRFDISKNYARLLPLGVHSLEAFNGHLLLSFMTTIVYFELQKLCHKQKYNAIDCITELRGITCGVYNDYIHIYEPTTKQKEILKMLKIELPTQLPLKS
jgi:hypothetical protein